MTEQCSESPRACIGWLLVATGPQNTDCRGCLELKATQDDIDGFPDDCGGCLVAKTGFFGAGMRILSQRDCSNFSLGKCLQMHLQPPSQHRENRDGGA
uniref:Uncharacterized protein n=1 Tax=Mycena chlorophos TaxID=658473 RepID=A0ABQ0LB40_MYCCL|nr:predicted protein [Mycena chlorophos]